MSHSNGMADRSKPRQPITTVLLAMIVAGPTAVYAPKHRVFPSMSVQPEAMVRSAAERDIVNEEPADGTPPVMIPGEIPIDSEVVPPVAPNVEAKGKADTEPAREDPTEPRYLGVVDQDGKMKAIFQVPGSDAPWVGLPGERIGETPFRLESLDGAISPLERTPDG